MGDSPGCSRLTQAAWQSRAASPTPREGLGQAAPGLPPLSALQVPQGYNYRAEVKKLIPQLQVLDEMPATHTGLLASRKLDRDWLMVKEAIKEGSALDGLLPRLGTAAAHLASGKRGLHPVPSTRQRLSATSPPRLSEMASLI